MRTRSEKQRCFVYHLLQHAGLVRRQNAETPSEWRPCYTDSWLPAEQLSAVNLNYESTLRTYVSGLGLHTYGHIDLYIVVSYSFNILIRTY